MTEVLDPRPDLREDAFFWRQALRIARPAEDFFALLHGLRCGGARITVNEKGAFKLDYQPVVDDWPGMTREEFQEKYLAANRDYFVALFKDLAKAA